MSKALVELVERGLLYDIAAMIPKPSHRLVAQSVNTLRTHGALWSVTPIEL
jgi:hypothetical protein